MNKPLIMIGAGGHASVLADILTRQGRTLIALVAPDASGSGALGGLPRWEEKTLSARARPESCLLVNGIGFMPGNDLRARIFSRYTREGYRFASVLANEASVSPHARLGQGVQIMQGAIVQSGAHIGDNVIVNTGAIVEHDCAVGEHCHLAPRAVLCGSVSLGTQVFVGCAAAVIQGISVGNDAVVGAGATVTRPVPERHIVYPARACFTTPKN
ncbi:acetyltransferase [Pluralibacter sp.]|uniref:acetyltransferase n=1 Tax=Pluralibacter sp. TaxID=1920032 RepID=UPI0025CC023B|nr:acetyltransferase [Pluralibacter sp.]MBV8043285.1 acetyltransferase [Pluralibacter sp.]